MRSFQLYDTRLVCDLKALASWNVSRIQLLCQMTLALLLRNSEKGNRFSSVSSSKKPQQLTKRISKGAVALDLAPKALDDLLSALTHVWITSALSKSSVNELRLSLQELKLNDEQVEPILQSFSENAEELAKIAQTEASTNVPQYHNMEWRLDIELATRCLHHKCEPSFVLQLETRTGNDSKAKEATSSLPTMHFYKADYAALKHVHDQLELALASQASVHCNRIQRYIR